MGSMDGPTQPDLWGGLCWPQKWDQAAGKEFLCDEVMTGHVPWDYTESLLRAGGRRMTRKCGGEAWSGATGRSLGLRADRQRTNYLQNWMNAYSRYLISHWSINDFLNPQKQISDNWVLSYPYEWTGCFKNAGWCWWMVVARLLTLD